MSTDLHVDIKCAICNNKFTILRRYENSRMVCQQCGQRMTFNNKPVKLYEDLNGLIEAYSNDKIVKTGYQIKGAIDGIPCIATIARFGGIIVYV